ncbi:MAG: pitrilysin family protein [Oligoflexia bacterium]|nr:pitrilysin family protein [Oligoflexia bacterium]
MAPTTAQEAKPLVGTSKVNQFTFPNGLKLLVVEDHSSPTFAYQTWFRVGSRDEILGKTGLAHLFEHMMFKATTQHPEGEFDRLLEAAGAEGENAFTSRDYTAYVQELPKDKLELIASLEADRMVHLALTETAFKTELEVVQNERRYRTENNPDGTMYQDLFGLAFKTHPYHWPVIGYQEDLNKMALGDAISFYRTYYSPNHATVVVVGDVSPTHVRDVISKFYGQLVATNTPSHAIPAEAAQTAARGEKTKLNIQIDKLLMGYHVPPISSSDMPAIDVFEEILSGGKSSRLYRALVDKGIASGVDTDDIDDKDPTLFIINANLQKGKHAALAQAVIANEIQKLKKELVGDEELQRAKNKITFDFYESLSNNSAKAHFLGKYESLTGDFENGVLEQQHVQSVNAAEVMAVAKKYFPTENRTVVSASPKGRKHK